MQMVKVMEIKANKYKANEILKFIRQNTNEVGRSRYYFSDLLEIANKYNLEIIIRDKEKK